jgi:hypothetical protein
MNYNFPFNLVPVSPLSHILLNICSKDDLIKLCEDYGVPYRKSMNKTNLSDCFEATLLKYPELLAKRLPFNDLLVLKQIVKSGGLLQSKKPLNTIVLESQMMVLAPKNETTTTNGKAPKKMFQYAIAENLRKTLEPIIDKIVANPKLKVLDRNERIMLGLLRIYGVLSEPKLREIWERTMHESLDPYDLIQMLRERISLKQEFQIFYANNQLCLASNIIDFPGSFYENIQKRNDLDYAQYPMDVVLSYADSPLQTANPNTVLQMFNLLNNKNNGDDILTTVQLGFIWESVQTGQKLTDLITKLSDISSWDSIQEINRLIQILTQLSNDMPQWLLKGHTPNELHTKHPLDLHDPNVRKNINDQIKQKFPEANISPETLWGGFDSNNSTPPANRVGRNDPCPCGSGKKYKKCCGAN